MGIPEALVWLRICCEMATEKSANQAWLGWLDLCKEEQDAVVSAALLGKDAPTERFRLAYRLYLRNEVSLGQYKVNVFNERMLSKLKE